MKSPKIITIGLFLIFPIHVSAFNGHIVKSGPLTIEIGKIETVTEYGKPCSVAVDLKNESEDEIEVGLQMKGLADQWYAAGDDKMEVSVSPGQSKQVMFKAAVGKGAYSALYPVHIYADYESGGKKHTAHAIQIIETDLPSEINGKDTEVVITVPANGALDLTQVNTQVVGWQYFGKELQLMPAGWTGSAVPSRASFSKRYIMRGADRYCLDMHPAWYGGAGTIFAEYQVTLPDTKPIVLSFANAIRDSNPGEPQSDGVSFRVWIDGKKVFDRHTDSKVWDEGKADLSSYAGRTVKLRLESHPGPAKNTTCDSSYWANPVISAGNVPKPTDKQTRGKMEKRAVELVKSAKPNNKDEFVFNLDGGFRAAAVLGNNGLLDGVIAFGNNEKSVVFEGLQVSVLNQPVGFKKSSAAVTNVHADKDIFSQRVNVSHLVTQGQKHYELVIQLYPEKTGLRAKVSADVRITDICPGPFNRKAGKVYWGHGYVIENPQAFKRGFGGHSLSTSHVGCDFEGGLSLLTACDNPPDNFTVEPDEKIYALHTHMNAVMTFVPSDKGAFDCAVRYQPLYDKKASPGFRNKAGRFVFDIWGGRYRENAEIMQKMIDYGLTDSLITLHTWQRWGYDYRLPDIYPPAPGLGTLEEMNMMGEVCNPHRIPWGLHDNYIDFYPDAEGYSYDHICFTESGQPIKAWINESRDAQSYRWRPDRFMPFMKRNMKLIKDNINPTHYFIDVFTSIDMFDFYDNRGNFHSFLETRQNWGDCFRWIQDYLGGAVTTSEAGDDQLTGWLDGADCQHLNISPTPKRFNQTLKCDDWARTPWFDAVLHDKFSLHGVGYSGRYQGGRSRLDHGIESDDYISDEMLLGHAMMIDRGAFGKGAVRKYWLGQDFIRSIATDTIESVEFAGDIHRQVVNWKSGAKVYVNRSDKVWDVAGRRLPKYGYYAVNGPIQSSIEMIDGVIIERSKAGDHFYVNGRGYRVSNRLEITPSVSDIEYLGDNRFKMPINWDCRQAAKGDGMVFIHFKSDKAERSDKIVFQGDNKPKVSPTKWAGVVVTGADRIIHVPQGLGSGVYDVEVGMWSPSTGGRFTLAAPPGSAGGSYLMGTLEVTETDGKVTGIKFTKNTTPAPTNDRWNVEKQVVDFGPVKTHGALLCSKDRNSLVVTPLLDIPGFDVELNTRSIMSRPRPVKDVVIIKPDGSQVGKIEFTQDRNTLKFTTRQPDFAYKIVF